MVVSFIVQLIPRYNKYNLLRKRLYKEFQAQKWSNHDEIIGKASIPRAPNVEAPGVDEILFYKSTNADYPSSRIVF